jgi:hypothetical protein
MLSHSNTPANTFDIFGADNALLILDQPTSEASALIERTEAQPEPRMEVLHLSHAVQPICEHPEQSYVCSPSPKTQDSAAATEATVTQEDPHADGQAATACVQQAVQELAKEAPDRAATLSVATTEDDVAETRSPKAPGGTTNSISDVSNVGNTAKSAAQNDDKSNDCIVEQHPYAGSNKESERAAQSGSEGEPPRHATVGAGEQMQNQEPSQASDHTGEGASVDHQRALLTSPAVQSIVEVPSEDVELNDPSELESRQAREFRLQLVVATLAFYIVLCDHAVTDYKLVEMFRSTDLLSFLKCPSFRKVGGVEEGQRTELVRSATQRAIYHSPEVIDLTGEDDNFSIGQARDRSEVTGSGKKRSRVESTSFQGRQYSLTDSSQPAKQPRTSPRCMAKGIRIIKDEHLRYKMDEKNHPLSDYLDN